MPVHDFWVLASAANLGGRPEVVQKVLKHVGERSKTRCHNFARREVFSADVFFLILPRAQENSELRDTFGGPRRVGVEPELTTCARPTLNYALHEASAARPTLR